MNEEEVKVKVVLPWLRERGVRLEDIQLETTFRVRVGTQDVHVGRSNRANAVLRPRLDILVRRRQRNLLVIEVKGANETLSDFDRDQAISYARLVHPIAPFALVTNGTEFRFYDVVTRDALDPVGQDLEADRAVALPGAARGEAVIPNGLVCRTRGPLAYGVGTSRFSSSNQLETRSIELSTCDSASSSTTKV